MSDLLLLFTFKSVATYSKKSEIAKMLHRLLCYCPSFRSVGLFLSYAVFTLIITISFSCLINIAMNLHAPMNKNFGQSDGE